MLQLFEHIPLLFLLDSKSYTAGNVGQDGGMERGKKIA